VFPGVPAEAWAPYRELYPDAIVGDEMRSPFLAFAIRADEATILVDLGQGPGPFEFLGGARGRLPDELKAAGIDPAGVDPVVFTHLHEDHTGWAVQDGKMLCERATHLAPEADWRQLGESKPGFSRPEALTALRDAGQLELVSGARELTPEIRIVPTPGHTPGHMGVEIESAGQRAFIAGDAAATPAQVEETEWAFVAEVDAEPAASARRQLMARLEQEGSVVAFAHFPPDGLGRIVREGGRRVFRPL